jgi:hypothetical protein
MKYSDLRGPATATILSLLSVSSASAATDQKPTRQPQASASGFLDAERAARLAADAGLELIGMHACADGSARCTFLATRQPNGEALLFRVTGKRCDPAAMDCLSGLTVSGHWGGRPGNRTSPAALAKISGKPGEDGAPPDPQHEAQAEATNEIIEALGDGKYDDNLDQFWSDLESIQTWDNPTWQEPDPLPPRTDSIRLVGQRGREPAVLVSGRMKDGVGEKDCGAWVSHTSSTKTIGNVGNWIGNALFDGCDSEVAVFAEDAAALLAKPEGRWSMGDDTLTYELEPPVRVPTSVWIVHADNNFAEETKAVETELETANDILEGSRCGIVIDASKPVNRTAVLADPEQEIGCASIETVLKARVGFAADRMNVYIVNKLIADDRAGVACTAESDNVIILDQGRGSTALAHEFGHWFDLWHTENMPLVDPRNIMQKPATVTRDKMTAGQCYRANFSKDSYINKQKLRSGKTKRCEHLQDADGQCPGLKNEF